MSIAELLGSSYEWADSRAWYLLGVALAVPALGSSLAWIGKRGRSDSDGRWLASVFVGFGLAVLAIEVLAMLVARYLMGLSLLDGNAVLIAAPILCVAGCIGGIRLVFPLRELASVKATYDVGLFALAGGALLWLLSKFRGWGILFLGWTDDLIVIAILAALLLRQLYRRAFRAHSPVPGT